jgi:hypothetical protein
MSIAGDWFNELGSMVTFILDPTDPRQIGGKYHTNVGQAQQKTYPLVGRCDDAALPDQVASWVVVWDPPDPPLPGQPPRKPSITAWVGQYHVVQEVEFITTTWLLARMTNAADDWESTMVSMDFFFRAQPTSQMINLAKQFGKVASHFNPPIGQAYD